MKNSLIIKADTIEEAVQTALSILGCSKDDIQIEVIRPPSKSLFGLRKTPAEVSVTRIHDKNLSVEEKEHVIIDEEALNRLAISEVNKGDPIRTTEISTSKEREAILLTDSKKHGVWIRNNQVIVADSDQRLPIIEADKSVKVYINDEKITKPQIVTSKDRISVVLEDEVIPGSFWVEIKDNDMMATLSIKPGQNIRRTLVESEPQDHLVIQAKEEVSYFFDLKFDDIMHRIQSLGIENGILHSTIKEMVENEITNSEMIIAKGIPPIEGLDGDIEILIDEWGEESENGNLKELEKVNYRERPSVLSVEGGQVIANVIPSVAGRAGTDLFERIVPPNPVKDVTLKLGKNVTRKDNHIVALSSGRPQIESKGKVVKVDIVKEKIHEGDVSLESGHIRFPGDIRILGNVLDHMTVEAEGRLYVNGTVNRAFIQSSSSMTIGKNVFSSELSAGKVNHIIVSLIRILTNIISYSEHIIAAVDQIQVIRSQQSQESLKLSYLIRLLLEKKYSDFIDLINNFYSIIEENEDKLDPEWKQTSNTLKEYFLTVTNSQEMQLSQLEDLVKLMIELHETNFVDSEESVEIELPYAINSTIYSSGNIHVTSQGIYHCHLQANHLITITGVCRGGHISAEKALYLNEVGSEYGGKTVLQVPSDGKIFVKYAHVDTVIQVGNRLHTCKQGTADVIAALDKEGNLQLISK